MRRRQAFKFELLPRESFRYPDAQQFKLDEANRRIFLPELGWMRLRLSRPCRRPRRTTSR